MLTTVLPDKLQVLLQPISKERPRLELRLSAALDEHPAVIGAGCVFFLKAEGRGR